MDDAAFERAVLESPDDDGPRLVYADWLDEQGDPRGEFIRTQVESEHCPAGLPRCPERVAREQALLAAHGPRWQRGLHGLAADCRFRRGFVEDVLLSVDQ